jgi:hypothetical protein
MIIKELLHFGNERCGFESYSPDKTGDSLMVERYVTLLTISPTDYLYEI